jgi:hypothetical protein
MQKPQPKLMVAALVAALAVILGVVKRRRSS